MIRIILINKHAVIRAGLRAVIESQPNMKVVGETIQRKEITSLVNKHNPQIVFMDLQMQSLNCFETIQRLLRINPLIKIIVLSAFTSSIFPSYVLQAGAMAYIPNNCTSKEIVAAMRTVLTGKRYISSSLVHAVALHQASKQSNVGFEWLSLRELQITLLILAGKNIHEIADELFLSPKTTMAYHGQLLKKINAINDVQLILRAKELGILENCSYKAS